MEQIRVTEQASAYDDLQRMSVHDLLTGINREDRRVADAVAATIPTMERLVERIVERMQRGGRMFYIGAGTSGRLAVTDASELPPTYGVPFDTVIGLIAGGDGALRKAVEHAEDDTEGAWRDMQPWRPDGGDILIGVAASGTTPYVVGGLRTARAHGLLTGAITCNPRSPVAAEAEYALEAVVGPEFVTGSTRMKAGTAQKLMLNMISTAVMIRLGRVEGNKMVNMQLTNNKLVDRGTRMIVQETGIAEAEARALLLLQSNGLIKLKDGVGITATKNDIVENPYNVEIVEAEAARLPDMLKDADYAVINSNYAINAGLNPVKDSLAIEGSSSAYANILTVKEGNENSPKILALKAALESQQVASFIQSKYNGSVVSTVTNPGNGYDDSVDYDALKGQTITVAASPTPHAEILEVAKEILAAKDITLDIQVYNDYVVPNTVVDDGTVDANYFQHLPYLEDFNAENNTHIVSVSAIHVEPMGLYGGLQTSLDALKASK